MKILHYEDTPEGGCLTTMCMWGVVILFAMLCALFFGGCDSRLKKENERLREELAKAQQYQPLQRDTIRDSVVNLNPHSTIKYNTFVRRGE